MESIASQTGVMLEEISHAVMDIDIAKGVQTQAADIESVTVQVIIIGSMIVKIVTGVKNLSSISMEIREADSDSERIINELSVSNDRTLEVIGKVDASANTTNESVCRRRGKCGIDRRNKCVDEGAECDKGPEGYCG